MAQSDFVALVPERLVHDCADKLQLVGCPFPVEGFAVGMVWHERSHGHSGHRWIRETVVSLIGDQSHERTGPPPSRQQKQVASDGRRGRGSRAR